MRDILIPFVKIDESQRLVYASLDETPDRGREIFDYASSKVEFEKWSAELAKASDGKSLGNVREMHQKVAAGKVVDLTFHDDARRIDFAIHVVDDGAWEKVATGVYTGISPGGSRLRSWPDPADPRLKRYTGRPVEVSLVDLPANPNATFTMVKADGMEEVLPLGGGSEPKLIDLVKAAEGRDDWRALVVAADSASVASAFGGTDMASVAEASGLAKRHFSADERKKAAEGGTALPDGSFPIEDRTDLENAIDALGRAKDEAAAKAHIIERAKALGATDLLPAGWPESTKVEKGAEAGDLRKGFGSVELMTDLIRTLTGLAGSVANEAAEEGDGSAVPGRLRNWLAAGIAILKDMTSEETAEALAGLDAMVGKLPVADPAAPAALEAAAQIADLAKRGARHSKADLDRLQAIHDHAVGMGAACSGSAMEKGADIGDLAKMAWDLAAAREDLAKAAGDNAALKERVAELEAEPAPGGPRLRAPGLRAVGKGEDVGAGGAPEGGAEADLKRIQAMPDGHEKTVALTRWSMLHAPRAMRS